MNFAPYQWRANDGYLPHPDSFAMPVTRVMGGGVPIQVVAYPYPQQQIHPFTYAHQIAYRGGCFNGGIVGVVAARPGLGPADVKVVEKEDKKEEKKEEEKKSDAGSKKAPPSTASTSSSSTKASGKSGGSAATKKSAPLPAPPAAPTKPTPSTTGSKTSKKSNPAPAAAAATSEAPSSSCANTYRAPTIRPGVNYMYPSRSSHTMLHIFNRTTLLWSAPADPATTHAFKIFRVSVLFTVKNVIERVRKDSSGEKCVGWAATEVVEAGNGKWRKGTTVEYEGEKAKGSLKSVGWDEKRGAARPPVWIVVHRC